MRKTLLIVATAAVFCSVGSLLTQAADLVPDFHRSVGHTGPRTKVHGCFGYYCFPLYGAYGPYGGTSYWGAYTDAGWGYRRW